MTLTLTRLCLQLTFQVMVHDAVRMTLNLYPYQLFDYGRDADAHGKHQLRGEVGPLSPCPPLRLLKPQCSRTSSRA